MHSRLHIRRTAPGVSTPKSHVGQAWIAWALMAIVVALSFVPLSFTIWLIAAPILPVAFMLTVLVLARGRMGQGLALMACQILVLPLAVAFGPMTASAAAATSPDAAPHTNPIVNSPDVSQPRLSPKLLELKKKLARQRSQVSRWLSEKLAVEKENGYLITNSEMDVNVETRRAIQQENLWREEVFAEISKITGRPAGEIAATYARLAANK